MLAETSRRGRPRPQSRDSRHTERAAVRLSTVYTVDLHTHSRFFHGWRGSRTRFDPVGIWLNGLVGRIKGLDALATTNHDYTYDADSPLVTSIPGIEVSTTRGHVVVVGPDPPERTEVGGLTTHEACDLAHDRGCAAILAHPYRGGTARDADADFDAIEVNGKNPEHIARTRELAAELDLPLVGGSDAHYPVEVARAYTRVEAEEPTPESVVDAIQDGRVTAVTRFSRFDSLVDRAYTRLHAAKHGSIDVDG